jgi:hypothetical protein
MRIALDSLPRLAVGVARGRRRLMEPLLELSLLPLAYHVLLLSLALLSSSAAVRTLGIVGLAIVAAHVLAALAVGGGGWRDLAALGGAPLYIAWKIGLAPIIGRAARRDAAWLRTERPTRGLR